MAAQSFPPSSSNLSYKVELSVSCSKLKTLDHFSKSDPVVLLYCRGREVEWTKVGRTELIENNLDPKVFGARWFVGALQGYIEVIGSRGWGRLSVTSHSPRPPYCACVYFSTHC